MIDKTQKIKGKNIKVKIFKTNLSDLESYGIKVPENLKHLEYVRLAEYVITNNNQTKYGCLWGDEQNKTHCFTFADFGDNMLLGEMSVRDSMDSKDYENGVTYAELEERNKEQIAWQLEKISKKVWYEQQSPLAKLFNGETTEIADSMHIKRDSIAVKITKTTAELLKSSGIKVPFGIEGKIEIDELALTTPDEKLFVLVRNLDSIKKSKIHSRYEQTILDSCEALQLYNLFGEDVLKGVTFKVLKDANKKYIENQLQKIAQLEK